MAGNYVGVNALARSGEAWPSIRLSSTLHANFWWNYFLRKSCFSLLSETTADGKPLRNKLDQHRNRASSLGITFWKKPSRVKISNSNSNKIKRILCSNYVQISRNSRIFIILFEILVQNTLIKLPTMIKLAMRYSDNSMHTYLFIAL